MWAHGYFERLRPSDLPKEFMTAYGGSGGAPLRRDAQSAAKGFHVRAPPASPQFQRKLELHKGAAADAECLGPNTVSATHKERIDALNQW